MDLDAWFLPRTLALVSVIFAQFCGGAAVEFESVGRAAPVASQPGKPAVFIVTSSTEAGDLPEVLTPEHRASVESTDFNSRVVIAVFRGAVGASGYAIVVRKIAVEQAGLRIVAELEDPPPDSNVRFGFTSPYHVVTIARDTLPGTRSWVLEDTHGRVLARTQ